MRSSLIGDESAVTGSAGQAPKLRDLSAREVSTCPESKKGDAPPPSTPLPEEENRDLRDMYEDAERSVEFWTQRADALLSENAALRAERDEAEALADRHHRGWTAALDRSNAWREQAEVAERQASAALSRLSALQERAERAEKALADERVVSARLTAWTDGYGGVDLTLAGGRRIALALGPPHEASAPGKSA